MTAADHHVRKSCKHYDIPGQAHALTFSCFRRRPFLNSPRACRWLADSIDRARSHVGFDLWAYVFMPEHVHLVLRPHDGTTISSILKAVKQPVVVTALRYVEAHAPDFLQHMADVQPGGRRSHRFWQRGGGYDRNLRDAAEVREKIDYVHANPVRRGLVTHPRQWPWSSWRAWNEDADAPLRIDRRTVPATG